MNLDHPANRGILSYLENPERLRRAVSVAASRRACPPSDIADPYYTLGTHPDLVSRLWDELGKNLPVDCRYVVFGAPVLLSPDSGLIFGFAGGTLTYALRLPPAARSAALSADARTVHQYPAYPGLGIGPSVLDLRDWGPEWVFGGWHAQEHEWCRAAYEAAAAGSSGS